MDSPHFSDWSDDTEEITSQDLPFLLELASPSDLDLPTQPKMTKVYLRLLPHHRYCLTPTSAEATHYALMPDVQVDYLEFTWDLYADGEGHTAVKLRSELQIEGIKRIVPRRLFLERELEGLLEFGVQFEPQQEGDI